MHGVMMQRYSTVSYRVVTYLALFAISVVACQSSDVPGEGRKPPRRYTEIVTSKSGENISFEMVPVPGGTFVMGSPAVIYQKKVDPYDNRYHKQRYYKQNKSYYSKKPTGHYKYKGGYEKTVPAKIPSTQRQVTLTKGLKSCWMHMDTWTKNKIKTLFCLASPL